MLCRGNIIYLFGCLRVRMFVLVHKSVQLGGGQMRRVRTVIPGKKSRCAAWFASVITGSDL